MNSLIIDSASSSARDDAGQQIIDTRNRIIHGYDSVSDQIMCGIIVNYLPSLKSEAEAIFLNQ